MRGAIIFGLEPVFAALPAWTMLGERMGQVATGGAARVVAGRVFSPMAPPRTVSGTINT